jgi:phosphatidylserine/phosphatidylglycerophosphate/cardiolipin synthase-like enzyme
VAFSRAQRNLIVVANLSYFKNKLARQHVMRGIVQDLESRALIMKADNFMTSVPHRLDVASGNVLSFASPPPQYFSEVEFSAAFAADVKEARYEIFIVSAFVSVTRVRAVRDLLVQQARSGVAITVVIPPLVENGSIDATSYEKAVGMLKDIGVAVIIRRALHAKLVCIDREVVWTGSLNPLSFSGKNTETMVRHVSSAAYASVMQQFALQGASKRRSPALLVNSTLK